MAESNILEVKNLSIQFGGLRAVDGLNMTIKKGQLYGLIGPNGAGKTTVFNMLTGVYKPTTGKNSAGREEYHGKAGNIHQQGRDRENVPEHTPVQGYERAGQRKGRTAQPHELHRHRGRTQAPEVF